MYLYCSSLRMPGETDDALLSRAFDLLGREGGCLVLDEPSYTLCGALPLSAHTTVLLENCRLLQTKRCSVCIGKQTTGPLKDLRILGRGNARIAYALTEDTPVCPPAIDLCGCSGFSVAGITFENSPGLSVSAAGCREGYIHDITDTSPAGGILLENGCCDCRVEYIAGSAGHPLVSCVSAVEACSRITIRHITLRNAIAPAVTLRGEGGSLHRISVQNIKEQGEGHAPVLVELRSIRNTPCEDISLENVEACSAEKAVICSIPSCRIKNVRHRGKGKEIFTEAACIACTKGIAKEDVAEMLRSLGITDTDTVAMHSSLRSIGYMEAGAATLLDGLTEYLSRGLLVIPTHTWSYINGKNPVFNVRTSPSNLGGFPNYCVEQTFLREDAVRSLHPTHSVAVFGKRAAAFAAGEENMHCRTPKGGVWSRFTEENAKVLLVGVGLERNTFMHSVDEEFNAYPNDPNRLFDLVSVDAEGVSHAVQGMDDFLWWSSDDFPLLEAYFRRTGVLTYTTLGNALVRCFDAKKGREAMLALCRAARDSRRFTDLALAAEENRAAVAVRN